MHSVENVSLMDDMNYSKIKMKGKTTHLYIVYKCFFLNISIIRYIQKKQPLAGANDLIFVEVSYQGCCILSLERIRNPLQGNVLGAKENLNN